ncbi:MAG: type II toxin-antitoxin system RelE/ParE family toxin [Bacteroides sp.]|nr:type II toxin-antitoxin system RelE/ParE family toxin [Bacteroides sp.]
MNCRITYTPDFAKALKHLAKKYKSIKEDYAKLLNDIRNNPLIGVDLGHRLRKIRMSIASKGKGKSGGARVITYTVILAETDAEIKLLTIYDKSERENLTDKELVDLMKANGL